MTTPTAFNKIQKLLWLGHKPRNINGVRPVINSTVVTPDHTALIEAFTDANAPIDYPGGEHINVKGIAKYDSDSIVVIRTDYLKTIINAIDSDCVRFYFKENSVLKICGSIDDVNIIARIAPRIGNDEEYYDDLYYTDTSPVIQQERTNMESTQDSNPESVIA